MLYYATLEKKTGRVLSIDARGPDMPMPEVKDTDCVSITPEQYAMAYALPPDQEVFYLKGEMAVRPRVLAEHIPSVSERIAALRETTKRFIETRPDYGGEPRYPIEKQVSINSILLIAMAELITKQVSNERRIVLESIIERCSEALNWILDVLDRHHEMEEAILAGEGRSSRGFAGLSRVDPAVGLGEVSGLLRPRKAEPSGVKLKDVIPGRTRKP